MILFQVNGAYAASTMTMVLLPTTSTSDDDFEAAQTTAQSLLASGGCTSAVAGDTLTPTSAGCFELTFDDASYLSQFFLATASLGDGAGVAIFTEHAPSEFELDSHYLRDQDGRDVEPRHTTDEAHPGSGNHESSGGASVGTVIFACFVVNVVTLAGVALLAEPLWRQGCQGWVKGTHRSATTTIAALSPLVEGALNGFAAGALLACAAFLMLVESSHMVAAHAWPSTTDSEIAETESTWRWGAALLAGFLAPTAAHLATDALGLDAVACLRGPSGDLPLRARGPFTCAALWCCRARTASASQAAALASAAGGPEKKSLAEVELMAKALAPGRAALAADLEAGSVDLAGSVGSVEGSKSLDGKSPTAATLLSFEGTAGDLAAMMKAAGLVGLEEAESAARQAADAPPDAVAIGCGDPGCTHEHGPASRQLPAGTGGAAAAAAGVTHVSAASVAFAVCVGDFMHNFTDGVLIGAAFKLCSPSIAWGMVAASCGHELAQEIADFVMLTSAPLYLPPLRALAVNFAVGLSVVVGGALVTAVDVSEGALGLMLAFGAGSYIYLGATVSLPAALSAGGHAHSHSQAHALAHAQGAACAHNSRDEAAKEREHTAAVLLAFVVGATAIGVILTNHKHCVEEESEEGGHGH
jgi:zinc transporter ZupT